MVLVQYKTEFIELLHITTAIIEASKHKEGLQEIREAKRQEVNEEAQLRYGGGSRSYPLV